MLVLAATLLAGCAGPSPTPSTSADPTPQPEPATQPTTQPAPEPGGEPAADVVQVVATGASGAYTFSVTLRSDETGCDQYADWWEVVDADGALVYRRVLGHSHVSEQPFARSGGPVDVTADEELLVRGHMNPSGYVGVAMEGSVSGGFASVTLPAGHLSDLAKEAPLPDGCAF